jgi:hypothetical protein
VNRRLSGQGNSSLILAVNLLSKLYSDPSGSVHTLKLCAVKLWLGKRCWLDQAGGEEARLRGPVRAPLGWVVRNALHTRR